MEQSFPPIKIPSLQVDDEILESIAKQRGFDKGFAKVLYSQLLAQINEFEKILNPEEEVAAYLASFGKEMIIQIEEISFKDPYFIIFEGQVNGSPVRLVQHVSQINVLFTSINIKELNRPARRLGFVPDNTGESRSK
ncbi:MAG: DUF6173 family protein [Anaerolineales bacterium]|jgi:hypothetical protein